MATHAWQEIFRHLGLVVAVGAANAAAWVKTAVWLPGPSTSEKGMID